jgi:hypothetical protein
MFSLLKLKRSTDSEMVLLKTQFQKIHADFYLQNLPSSFVLDEPANFAAEPAYLGSSSIIKLGNVRFNVQQWSTV